MANLSPRKRLKMAIDRIERTGWCQWAIRCRERRFDDDAGIESFITPIEDAPVCALGALITDLEVQQPPRLGGNIARPGVKKALEVVGEVMPKATLAYLRDPGYITTWNDNLPSKTGKRIVLTTFKRALAKLEGKPRGKNAKRYRST